MNYNNSIYDRAANYINDYACNHPVLNSCCFGPTGPTGPTGPAGGPTGPTGATATYLNFF